MMKKKVKELNDKLKLSETKSDQIINLKNEEIKDLKIKLANVYSITSINQGEKVIAVYFVSTSQDINFPMACKNTETISRIEEKLYNEYPKYKEYNTYLTVNGNVIKRFKTIEENGINYGNTIIVNILDE